MHKYKHNTQTSVLNNGQPLNIKGVVSVLA